MEIELLRGDEVLKKYNTLTALKISATEDEVTAQQSLGKLWRNLKVTKSRRILDHTPSEHTKDGAAMLVIEIL